VVRNIYFLVYSMCGCWSVSSFCGSDSHHKIKKREKRAHNHGSVARKGLSIHCEINFTIIFDLICAHTLVKFGCIYRCIIRGFENFGCNSTPKR